MRTTLTLDDDVAAALERVRRRQKASLKSIVNAALRVGLASLQDPNPQKDVYTTPAVVGDPLISNVDDIQGLLEQLEGAQRR